MTEPLYYADPLVLAFQASVRAVDHARGRVVLDRTCFYPEGGGQPGDTGRISCGERHLTVTDTRKGPDGDVEHVVAGGVNAGPGGAIAVGTPVSGTVDEAHRLDYMQQHTGQHLVSAGLVAVADAATVSVHQGAETTTIEVDRADLADREIGRLEDWVNERVAADRAVRSFEVSAEQLERYRLRRPTSRTGPVRLVEIEETDLVACGGVHLPRTALVGPVLCAGSERIRGNLRLAFWIGRRALDTARVYRDVLTRVAVSLSAHPVDVADRTDAAIADAKATATELRRLGERLAAVTLGPRCERAEPFSQVFDHESDRTFEWLVMYAADHASAPVCVANLAATGTRWALVFRGAPDLVQRVRREIFPRFGARGGGKPPLLRGVLGEPEADGSRLRHAEEFCDACLRILTGG